MSKDPRVIVIHGTGGSPDENWFPWLQAEFASRDIETIIPEFPTPQNQNLENWLTAFEKRVGTLRQGDVLIGHSIGAAFVLRLLENTQMSIRAAILVAGFDSQLGDPRFDPFNESFLKAPFSWEKIIASANEFIVFAGDNDPYVPIKFGLELSKNLGTTLRVIKGGGHLNSSSGFTTFPQLLSDLNEIIGRQ